MASDDPAWLGLQLKSARRAHRVFQTWSPAYDVFLMLAGGTDALLCYRCDGHETPTFTFLARSLGAERHVLDATPQPPWLEPRAFALVNACSDAYGSVISLLDELREL